MATLRTDVQRQSTPVPSYYQIPEIPGFTQFVRDFDDKQSFLDLERRVRNESSQNFFIDFGNDEAWCSFNVDVEVWAELLQRPQPEAFDTRWINIWAPQKQTKLIELLAKKYGFSPRLTGLMQSQSLHRNRKYPNSPTISPGSPRHFKKPYKANGRSSADIEKRFHSSTDDFDHSADPLLNLNHYDLVNSIWHFSSVDWGSKYLCVGYNSLHNITTTSQEDSAEARSNDLPNGVRIWNWLILGHDKTVITITEDCSPHVDFYMYRRNLINVFRQLSMSTEPYNSSAITLVPIRYNIGYEDQDSTTSAIDAPGLLFYYLFDDWYGTYKLLAKQENQYRVELNRLRETMRQQANLTHVDELHHIGRQLATLLRLYRSYELIVDRIMEKQTPPPAGQLRPYSTPASSFQAAPGTLSPVPTRPSLSGSMSNTSISGASPDLMGVFLTSSSRLRFERLRDRIRLYAISEIEECIELKESLVGMNFNLITIRESNSVERLTRITILLAKVTILFLPVSLMTGYFSVQIPDANFTIHAYWIAFAVVIVLSFFLIWIFGKISGTVEGQMVYTPINRVLLDLGKGLFGRATAQDRDKDQ